MSPIISEEDLENLIKEQEEVYDDISFKLKSLRRELVEAEDEFIGTKLELDKLKERLKEFRLMYPDLCKTNI